MPPGESQINDIGLTPSGYGLFSAAADKVLSGAPTEKLVREGLGEYLVEMEVVIGRMDKFLQWKRSGTLF